MSEPGADPGELTDVPKRAEVRESGTSFRSGRVIEVRTDEVVFPDGSSTRRDVVVHPGAVGIIALNEAGEVLLVRQYRHPVGHVCWEPPAGLLDEPGEDPLLTAKRELFEEAHHEADCWDVLVDLFTSPGMTDEAVRVYLARDVRECAGDRHEGADEERDMVSAWVPLDRVVAAVFDGRLHNPLAVSGVLAADHARRSGFTGLRAAGAPWPQMSDWPGSGKADGGRSS